MPASAFFLMLNAARLLSAGDKVELCDIQAISICSAKYQEETKGIYQNQVRLFWELKSGSITRKIGEVNSGPVDAASDDAKYAMMAMFTTAKGG